MRLFAALAVLTVGRLAAAQDCDFPVCPSGREFTGSGSDASGPYGVCKHCAGFPTFACSHTLERCPSGSTLDPKTGQCELIVCTSAGGCGAELPLCPSDRTYSGSGTSPEGVYGTCKHCDGFPTWACSHTIEYCREGWTLQTATGMCRKDCLPDLDITSAYLRDAAGSYVTSVRVGRPYYICASVRNIGLAASPNSVLSGGGLGIPYAPTASVPALAAATSITRCLYYPTTPSVGTWVVGLTADSAGTVAEMSEGNNTYSVTVPVVP